MDIKGKREPVQAYEVVRERRTDSESLQEPVGNDYLIGRENELAPPARGAGRRARRAGAVAGSCR